MNQRNYRLRPPLRSTAQCCNSQYFTQYFELLSNWTSAHRWFFPHSPRRSPGGAPCNGRTVHAPVASSTHVPDGGPPIRDPAPPVGMVRRPSRPVAIATCPTTISSPRLPRGTKGPGRIEGASLFIFIVQVFTTSRLVSLQCNTVTTAIWLNQTKL